MPATISAERPDSPDATALVTELDDLLIPMYPIENHHGLAVDQLIAQGVDFFVLRTENGEPAGCAGIKFLDSDAGEVKRMFVRPQFRGHGFAKLLLDHLTGYARAHGLTCLRLETGIRQTEAISLYERMGFRQIGPFGDYHEDPLSRFYEKQLE